MTEEHTPYDPASEHRQAAHTAQRAVREAPKVHVIKTLTKPFESMLSGAKKADLRLNDRDYQVHDLLVQREVEETEYRRFEYTGRYFVCEITDITEAAKWIGISAAGWVMLSIEVLTDGRMP